ncbi:uncharacterized protein LOC125516954 [Triticum urartu]|uniref:uncharacterized protein LOC125516954 n=1 Tax=Triticum urartu TaxID=4572 RepID=UPI002042F9A3|nr:uncharacterized protein LOC125516954 [Triticum urartu]
MAHEAERFASYISYWESAWSRTCGFFIDQTALTSMQYTHYTPGRIPTNSAGSTPETLQILSIKLAEIAGGFKWPLSVYGVVAARDIVDHNRNILFSCIRSQAQELKHDDPFLRLTGPTRAIVCSDTVEFEIQLKVKGTTQSQDEALIRCARDCSGGFGHGVSTVCYKNSRCTLELCLQRVAQTVQATILGIQVVKGSWPFEHGARVACSSLSGEIVCTDAGLARIINPSSSQIVLLDSKDGAKLKGFDGHLHVWRQVVSVGTRGELGVEIQAYSKSGDIATRGHVSFMTKFCNISQEKCALDGAEVLITVAWSLVPTERCLIVDDGSRRGNLV